MKKLLTVISAFVMIIALSLNVFAQGAGCKPVSESNELGGLSPNEDIIREIEEAATEKREAHAASKADGVEIAELGAIYSYACPTVIQASSLNPTKEQFYQLLDTEIFGWGQGTKPQRMKPMKAYLFQLNTETTTQYIEVSDNSFVRALDGVWSKAPIFTDMLDTIIDTNDGMKSYMLFYDYFTLSDFYAIVFNENDVASYVVESDGEIYDYGAYSQATLNNLEELGYEFETVGGIYHPIYHYNGFFDRADIKDKTKAVNGYIEEEPESDVGVMAACVVLSVLLAVMIAVIIAIAVKNKKRA